MMLKRNTHINKYHVIEYDEMAMRSREIIRQGQHDIEGHLALSLVIQLLASIGGQQWRMARSDAMASRSRPT